VLTVVEVLSIAHTGVASDGMVVWVAVDNIHLVVESELMSSVGRSEQLIA
jgi:hypothetical protein